MAKKHKILCFRCGHSGETHLAHPKRCPRCNSPYYDKPKVRGGGWSYISPHVQVQLVRDHNSAVINHKGKNLDCYDFKADENGQRWYKVNGILKELTVSMSAEFAAILMKNSNIYITMGGNNEKHD